MKKKIDFSTPKYTTAQEIKKARKKLSLTQREFANFIGCSKPTVERWEVSDKEITGPIVLLVQLINDNPDLFTAFMLPEKRLPLRIKYMHNNSLCTLIDVDEINRKVEVVNFTDNIILRAFGANDSPGYDDYVEFLKSRCFPESRDKMKLILKDLNLPFYDPLMIIEKTEGRMAEDNFWIALER